MRTGANPVLRVNSGGVLAKLGPLAADQVLDALMPDADMRHLYLTAVISRFLHVAWDEASRLAALSSNPNRMLTDVSDSYGEHLIQNFASELKNPRDAVARWCSGIVLAQVQPVAREDVTRALQSALMQETSTLNLRTIGNVLAGSSPLPS
jgi:hypothetical protein